MDFFLFEKYGLDEKEENSSIIEKALEAHKEKEGWEAKLNSKNDKIRSRAKEEKQRWSEDRELLLDKTARANYLEQYYAAVREIIEYINDSEAEESSFDEIAAIQGISIETVKLIYEKHKNLNTGSNVNLNEVQELAFKINKVQNAFNTLLMKCDASVKSKFIESGINLTSLFDSLSVSNCKSAKEIEANSYKISKLAYDLYNKQLFSSDIKNGFMDIFDAKSTKVESVVSFIGNENLDRYFSINSWVLLRYIRTTCTLMKKTGAISTQKIVNIASNDRASFAQAMNQVFGVSFEGTQIVEASPMEAKNQIPNEVVQGENLLRAGNFKAAASLFAQVVRVDPYCWQAYWGLFKASISAKTDDEIYFPGFLQTLRDSEVSEGYPDYVDYYKSAKFNATAQRATEINFNAIEMEYKNADKVQASYMAKVEEIKERYEDNDPNSLDSEKAREISMRANQKVREYSSWLMLKEKGNSTNIKILAGGILLFALAALSIWSLFSMDVADFIAIGSIVIGVLLGLLVASESVIIGIIVGIISVAVFAFLATLAIEYTFIFAPICVMLGGVVVYIAVKKIKKVRSADAVILLIEGELKGIFNELLICYSEELKVLCSYPSCRKYRINVPNIVPDFSSYFRGLGCTED